MVQTVQARVGELTLRVDHVLPITLKPIPATFVERLCFFFTTPCTQIITREYILFVGTMFNIHGSEYSCELLSSVEIFLEAAACWESLRITGCWARLQSFVQLFLPKKSIFFYFRKVICPNAFVGNCGFLQMFRYCRMDVSSIFIPNLKRMKSFSKMI